jgi:lipopolysaccharide export LptBFGC system permease protein LptF
MYLPVLLAVLIIFVCLVLCQSFQKLVGQHLADRALVAVQVLEWIFL